MSRNHTQATTPTLHATATRTENSRKLTALRTDDYDVMAPACPSRTVLRHLTDRWTPLIVANLEGTPMRFGQLREAVGGITAKVLTQTLRSMERDGLVTREVIASIPPQVTYELTGLGHTLTDPILALRDWINNHAGEVLAAREVYDAS
ncbi:MAG: helix-turn-helix transcriptional regulator [Actinomyces sp.]|nr:helix-turn-helix transcriptional regulator [Actinomyces sp.]